MLGDAQEESANKDTVVAQSQGAPMIREFIKTNKSDHVLSGYAARLRQNELQAHTLCC